MILKTLPQLFTISKLPSLEKLPTLTPTTFLSVTEEEISLVCPTVRVPENTTHREDGWRGFYIAGELDFSLIGILAKISAILAGEGIGIFVVSTYNTDYVFVKEENFRRAMEALKESGYLVQESAQRVEK